MKKRNLLSKFILPLTLCSFLGISSLNAQTLTHSYTFEDGTYGDGIVNDVVGDVNGVVSGGIFEDGAYVMFNGDEFIEFDAAALALNTYDAITVETYVKRGNNGDNEFNAVWSFNGYRASNDFLLSIVRGSSTCQTEVNGVGVAGPEPANDEIHHYVSVLTKESLKLYIDGILVNEESTSGDFISTLGVHPEYAATAYIGKSTWPDASFKGSLYEWNIYNGVLDDATIYTHAKDFSVVSDDSKLKSLSATSGSLYPSFNPSVTQYTAVLDPGTTSIDITALAFEQEALVMKDGGMDLSNIATTDGSGDITITVIGSGDNQTDYTIHYVVNTDLTLMHSYDFNVDYDVSDGTGSVDGSTGFLNVFGGAWHADGDPASKITLDGAALALNTYPSITFEGHVTLGENGGYTLLYYFGGDGNNNTTLLRLTASSDVELSRAQMSGQDVGAGAFVDYAEQEAGTDHHYVVVLSYGYIKYYLDGALVGETTITNSANFISSIGTDVAYLGIGTWDDPLLYADVDEFNIYSGEMDAATVAERCTTFGITPTGVKKTVAKISKVYPTISSDVFNVEFTEQAGNVTVYDLSGNVVKQIKPEGLATTFTVNKAGIYIVQVTSGNVINTYKVVKK